MKSTIWIKIFYNVKKSPSDFHLEDLIEINTNKSHHKHNDFNILLFLSSKEPFFFFSFTLLQFTIPSPIIHQWDTVFYSPHKQRNIQWFLNNNNNTQQTIIIFLLWRRSRSNNQIIPIWICLLIVIKKSDFCLGNRLWLFSCLFSKWFLFLASNNPRVHNASCLKYERQARRRRREIWIMLEVVSYVSQLPCIVAQIGNDSDLNPHVFCSLSLSRARGLIAGCRGRNLSRKKKTKTHDSHFLMCH